MIIPSREADRDGGASPAELSIGARTVKLQLATSNDCLSGTTQTDFVQITCEAYQMRFTRCETFKRTFSSPLCGCGIVEWRK